MKHGTFSFFARGENHSTAVLYNFFTYGQLNTGATVFASAMQPLKQGENFICIALVKADAIVFYGDDMIALLQWFQVQVHFFNFLLMRLSRFNVDFWFLVWFGKLQSVTDEVLK